MTNESTDAERFFSLLRRACEPRPVTRRDPNVLHRNTLTSIELTRERAGVIVPILKKANGGDVHVATLAKQLAVPTSTLMSWLDSQVLYLGNYCPWEFGRNRSHFKLSKTTRQFDAAAFIEHQERVQRSQKLGDFTACSGCEG